MSTDVEADRAEILRLHHEWWEANRDMDHERMRVCFAEGAAYYQFNLNGHPYYGIDEKVELWKAYGKDALTIPDLGPDEHHHAQHGREVAPVDRAGVGQVVVSGLRLPHYPKGAPMCKEVRPSALEPDNS